MPALKARAPITGRVASPLNSRWPRQQIAPPALLVARLPLPWSLGVNTEPGIDLRRLGSTTWPLPWLAAGRRRAGRRVRRCGPVADDASRVRDGLLVAVCARSALFAILVLAILV